MFPFANSLLTAVPTEAYVEARAFPAAFLPALGTVCSAFSLILAVATLKDRSGERKLMIFGTVLFVVGFLVLLVYMSEYQSFIDVRARLGDDYADKIAPVILYPAFFSMFTVAFALLALGAKD